MSGLIRIRMWLERTGTISPKVSRGGRLNSTITSVEVNGNFLPQRMKMGTPAQRQLSMATFTATKVSTVEAGLTPGTER